MAKIGKTKVLSLYEIMNKYKTQADVIKCCGCIRWGNKPICTKCGCDDKIAVQKAGDYWLRKLSRILQRIYQHIVEA